MNNLCNTNQNKKVMNIFNSVFLCGLFVLHCLETSFASIVSTGDYNKDFHVVYSPNHANTSADGRSTSLKLDQDSGSAFTSNSTFLYGQINMQIKLIPGYSAGTVVAFYLASNQPNRHEIDFEFLGNVSGQPYTLQTNVITGRFASREERINLWFDPTKNFHTYSVLWNIYQLVFMVDRVPIRTYKNYATQGVAYPRRAMSVLLSIWDGSSWATGGGKYKVDWSKGPFIASFANYTIDACIWKGDARTCRADSSDNWWNRQEFSSLTREQSRLLRWARRYHLTYDYCRDNNRFHDHLPQECSLPKF